MRHVFWKYNTLDEIVHIFMSSKQRTSFIIPANFLFSKVMTKSVGEDLFLSCLQQFFNPLIKMKHDLSLDQNLLSCAVKKYSCLTLPKLIHESSFSRFLSFYVLLSLFSTHSQRLWYGHIHNWRRIGPIRARWHSVQKSGMFHKSEMQFLH